jgi:hypothetical protein
MTSEALVMLAPKTASLDARGAGSGTLRPEDVAMALAGLSEGVDLAIERGWHAPRGSEVWRKMAILALCEVIGMGCGECDRRGYVYGSEDGGSPAECIDCGGSGLRRLTTDEREQALGQTGYRWLRRYEHAYRRIGAWQTTLYDHLRRRLGQEPAATPDRPRSRRPTAAIAA